MEKKHIIVGRTAKKVMGSLGHPAVWRGMVRDSSRIFYIEATNQAGYVAIERQIEEIAIAKTRGEVDRIIFATLLLMKQEGWQPARETV